MTLYIILVSIVLIAGGISTLFFRKGGIYNPKSNSSSTDGGFVMPSNAQNATSQPSSNQKLYSVAKSCLGLSLYGDLNPNIPEEYGCAASVSEILKLADYVIPPDGIPTVLGLKGWALANGWKISTMQTPGNIILAHNPEQTITTGAHIGICLIYGIGSNNSSTGIFDEYFSPYEKWNTYFEGEGSVTEYLSPP